MTTLKPRTECVRRPDSADFGMGEWNLDLDELRELIDKAINKTIAEGVRLASKEYKCQAWFPIEFDFGDEPRDDAPADPTTIAVELPLGEHEDESPRWTFTLSEIVDSMLYGFMVHGKIGDCHVRSAKAIRDGLRSLADRIDASLP